MQPGIAAGNPATAARRRRDPGGRRQRRRRGGCGDARLVCRRVDHDRAARRRARDLLRRRVGTVVEPRLLLLGPFRRGRRARRTSRCRSARSSSTTRSARRRSRSPASPPASARLHERFGRLPWRDLFEPAMRLARGGVEMTPAHASCLAMLAPVMTMDAGERIYAPDNVLAAGGRHAAAARAREGALRSSSPRARASMYTGSLAQSVLSLMRARGGLVTADDLATTRPIWSEPRRGRVRRHRVLTRGGLSRLPGPAAPASAAARAERDGARARPAPRARRARRRDAHDERERRRRRRERVRFTTSLGLGTGDFLPGLDLHLNSMLGEVDLVVGDLVPGERMGSMMAPSLVLDDEGLVLAAGAAGGTRLRDRARARRSPGSSTRASSRRRPSTGRAFIRPIRPSTPKRASTRRRSPHSSATAERFGAGPASTITSAA